MKFVICLAFLAFAAAVVSGQEAENDQALCDEDFLKAFNDGSDKCFPRKEKEVAEALLGQPAPASVREILRRRRSGDGKDCKKEWLNDPEKRKQMIEKIDCVEKKVEHTTLYKTIKPDCEKKMAEITDETVDKQFAEYRCIIKTLHKVCDGKLPKHGKKDGNRKARPE